MRFNFSGLRTLHNGSPVSEGRLVRGYCPVFEMGSVSGVMVFYNLGTNGNGVERVSRLQNTNFSIRLFWSPMVETGSGSDHRVSKTGPFFTPDALISRSFGRGFTDRNILCHTLSSSDSHESSGYPLNHYYFILLH